MHLHAHAHGYMYAQMDRQPKNIMPPAPSVGQTYTKILTFTALALLTGHQEEHYSTHKN